MKTQQAMRFFMIAVCVCLVSYGGYLLIRDHAYARVERLTQSYAHEVEPFIEEFAQDYDLNIVYFKVFEYEAVRAKVFVVDKQAPYEGNNAGGAFMYLERRDLDSAWELAKPVEVVWALSGSADGRTWPPYGLTDPFAERDDR